MKGWYEEFFTNYAEKYDTEVFTKGTSGEVDFLEKELGFDKSKKILDVGCGTGRHAIELTKRGYHVVGVDLSESQLNRAKQKAKEQNLTIDFQIQDARNLPFDEEFDMIIMLCEGGFSLMETDEENFDILKSCKNALKPGGTFIFTMLCAFFPLFNDIEKLYLSEGSEGCYHEKVTFDMLELREKSTLVVTDDLGVKKTIHCNERFFVPTEIRFWLSSLGFKDISLSGARLGEFSKDHPITKQDFEMLAVATKL